MYTLVEYLVHKMEILKSILQVLCATVGLYGRRVLSENLLLDGLTNMITPENENNISISSMTNILQARLQAYTKNPEEENKRKGKEYQKKWAEAVEFFRIRLNKDRKKAGQVPLPFIAVRQKLVALKEIDDLRWFYLVCQKYSNTWQKERDAKGYPVRNTFHRCFFGALDTKKIK